ncbi:MAG TPA: hypothetical protein VKA08_11480 [Balneolales bacterium]|nr:hypothetical protein [Balneolales bacterium]
MTNENASKKLSFRTFTIIILSIDAAFLIFGGYPVFRIYGFPALLGMIVALVMTTANVLAGYWIIIRSFHLDMSDFMKRVFGGMGIRMFVLMGLIVIILLVTKINQNSFIISLFISYICKSVIEIIFINKRSQNHRVSTSSN